MIWLQVATAATIAVIIVILLAMSIRIAKEYERGVVFRLGRLVGNAAPAFIFFCRSSSGSS